MNTTEWVFRHAGGCLIESPDITTVTPPYGRRWSWVATLWRESGHCEGWRALEWLPGERGWQLPITLAVGDVIEFGTGWFDNSGNEVTGHSARWFGWLHHATERAVVVIGPFTRPEAAEAAARPLIDELRLAQLAPVTTDWNCPLPAVVTDET